MKVLAFFVALLFVSVRGFEVDPCKLDNEHGCKDYSAAEKCKTTALCKEVIWNQPINNNTRICQFCLDDVGNLQKFIDAKATRQFVKYDLLAICRVLPFAVARDQCTSSINKNFDKIYQDIVNKLDPKVICRALCFCHASNSHAVILDKIREHFAKAAALIPEARISTIQADNNTCSKCKVEFEELEAWSKGLPKDYVKGLLLSFCDNLTSFTVQQTCHNRVDLNFELIYNEIAGKADPKQICEFIWICEPDKENDWQILSQIL